jgi:hypothetical protein
MCGIRTGGLYLSGPAKCVPRTALGLPITFSFFSAEFVSWDPNVLGHFICMYFLSQNEILWAKSHTIQHMCTVLNYDIILLPVGIAQMLLLHSGSTFPNIELINWRTWTVMVVSLHSAEFTLRISEWPFDTLCALWNVSYKDIHSASVKILSLFRFVACH